MIFKKICLFYLPFLLFLVNIPAYSGCNISDTTPFSLNYYRNPNGATSSNQTTQGVMGFEAGQLASMTLSSCPGITLSLSQLTFTAVSSDTGISSYDVNGNYTVQCDNIFYNYLVQWNIDCKGTLSGTVTGNYTNGQVYNIIGNYVDSSSTTVETYPDLIIDSVNGDVFYITPNTVTNLDKEQKVPSAGVIYTSKGSSVTILDDDNTKVRIEEKTIVSSRPKKLEFVDQEHFYQQYFRPLNLYKGKINITATYQPARVLTVKTAGVKVKARAIKTTAVRSSDLVEVDTTFSVTYEQEALDGTTTIDVTSGSVEVIKRDGSSDYISAGQEATYTEIIYRSSWVLPIDGSYLYTGIENYIIWLTYPNAQYFLLEYNVPNPVFASENPNQPEFINKSIKIDANFYTVIDGLVILSPVNFDKSLYGIKLEMRIFPLDGNGNIIPDSVASDKVDIEFK